MYEEGDPVTVVSSISDFAIDGHIQTINSQVNDFNLALNGITSYTETLSMQAKPLPMFIACAVCAGGACAPGQRHGRIFNDD